MPDAIVASVCRGAKLQNVRGDGHRDETFRNDILALRPQWNDRNSYRKGTTLSLVPLPALVCVMYVRVADVAESSSRCARWGLHRLFLAP